MKILLLLAVSLLTVVECEEHRGRYVSSDGEEFHYRVENTESYSSLQVDRVDETTRESMVEAILYKENGDIRFHMMGNDHFDSSEEDFEAEALATRDLMETSFGRHLPEMSRAVYEDTGVNGRESEGMMLLHQLAMFSHNYHEGRHTPTQPRRVKRNALSALLGADENGVEVSHDVKGIFPDEIVKICESSPLKENGGCTVDLGVELSDNVCVKHDEYDFDENWAVVHQFSADEISKGCYGLCGPWCTCWSHVCGDCCWHPGCYQHDKYCDKPNSLSCKLGRGVVFGRKGLHTC